MAVIGGMSLGPLQGHIKRKQYIEDMFYSQKVAHISNFTKETVHISVPVCAQIISNMNLFFISQVYKQLLNIPVNTEFFFSV